MRTSPCCGAPAAPHGARRRRCSACGETWTVRPRRRGRKRLRTSAAFAARVLRSQSSLRGIAASCGRNRERVRRQFHRSLAAWLRTHPASVPKAGSEPLIAVVDVLWFQTVNHRPAWGCFTVLLRPVSEPRASVVMLRLLPGRESVAHWERVFAKLPGEMRRRIVAVVADGFTGLMSIAERSHWHFQWCHVHVKRRMAELRGVRRLPGRAIRRKAWRLVTMFLETPDAAQAERCRERLRALFRNPDCPRSIVRRLSGVVRRAPFLRTYRAVPSLNLPVTTNSVEYVHRQIRERFAQMRGVNSARALRRWIAVLHRSLPTVACRGFRETIEAKCYRNSVS